MRIFVPAIAVAGLLGFASAAFAMDATGTIKALDAGKDMVTLDNGMSYMAPKSVSLSAFKVGEKVTINYDKSGDKMDITSIKSAT
jgi:Cu/Ag efflux protein CusF